METIVLHMALIFKAAAYPQRRRAKNLLYKEERKYVNANH